MLTAAEMARVIEKMTGEVAILELELHGANEAKQQLLNEVTEVRIEGAERAANIEGAVEGVLEVLVLVVGNGGFTVGVVTGAAVKCIVDCAVLPVAKTEAHAAREELTMAEDRCLTLDKRVPPSTVLILCSSPNSLCSLGTHPIPARFVTRSGLGRLSHILILGQY